MGSTLSTRRKLSACTKCAAVLIIVAEAHECNMRDLDPTHFDKVFALTMCVYAYDVHYSL